MAMNLPAAIKSANEILSLARQHERKKFIASSSVMLTVEMVKISNAINAYQGEPTRETRTLEELFEQCRILEDQCRTAARRRMMVYGLLYKRGHIIKNWQMRMFVLDGGQLSYYQLGETEAKGHLMLHLIRKVSLVQMENKRNCFKVETTNKEYIMQAPDEASLQIWMDALRPYKEGWLTKQGAVVKNWKRRWFVLYKTQLAYFDGASGGSRKERNGYILLKEVLPGSVHPVDEQMFGKPNVFQIETKERTFFLQGDTVDIMDDWLDSILRSIQTRGRLQSVSQALEAGEMSDGDGGDVSRDSTMLAPDAATQAAIDKMAAESREYDEEDGYEPQPEPEGGYGNGEYVMAPPIADMPLTQEDIAQGLALQHQLGKAYRTGEGGLTGASGVAGMLTAHEADLEIQRKEMELEMRSKEHEIEMRSRERELQMKQKELELELKMLEQQGGGAAATEAVEAAVEQRSFVLLVHSEDTELLPEQRKCSVSAGTASQLAAAIEEKMALPCEIAVLTFDEDFEEYVLLSKLDDLPGKAKVQIKRKVGE